MRRVVVRAAALEAQQARQAAAERLAARHQERLAALSEGRALALSDRLEAQRVVVAHQVVHPVGGPAQLWAAPLGADPADLRQWVHLGPAEGPVTVEVPADQVPARLVADRGLWQVVQPAPLELPALPDLEVGARWAQVAAPVGAQVQALGEALGRGLAQSAAALAGLDWYQAVHQVLADLDPVASPGLEELERLEEDRCPVGLARSGLAGVLVPRGAAGLGLCPCPRCHRQ